MGTSSSFGGPKSGTPLLPSWANPITLSPDAPNRPEDLDGSQPLSSPDIPQSSPNTPILTLPIQPSYLPQRFRSVRNNFTRYLSSGGKDKTSLKRALKGYVSTASGGSRIAGKRMWASQQTAANLLGFLREVHKSGVQTALQRFSLGPLIGKQPKDILTALTDVVCVANGPIDEGIAREAFIETIVELSQDNENLIIDETSIKFVTIQFIAKSIVTKILNDAGTKYNLKNASLEQINMAIKSLHDFVYGAIKDRISTEIETTLTLESDRLITQIANIYEVAFDVMEGEVEKLV